MPHSLHPLYLSRLLILLLLSFCLSVVIFNFIMTTLCSTLVVLDLLNSDFYPLRTPVKLFTAAAAAAAGRLAQRAAEQRRTVLLRTRAGTWERRRRRRGRDWSRGARCRRRKRSSRRPPGAPGECKWHVRRRLRRRGTSPLIRAVDLDTHAPDHGSSPAKAS